MLIVHFLQQLLCQWKNGIERGQLPGLRNAAGDLTEIMELDFQRQRISPEILMLQTSHQFHRRMIQFDNDRCLAVDVLFQGMLAPDRLADTHCLYRTKINPPGKIIINTSHFPKLTHQHCLRTGAKLFAIVYSQGMHLLCRHRAHSPKTLYRQTSYKLQSLIGMNSA